MGVLWFDCIYGIECIFVVFWFCYEISCDYYVDNCSGIVFCCFCDCLGLYIVFFNFWFYFGCIGVFVGFWWRKDFSGCCCFVIM